jgi:hypothetical protein
MICIFCGNNEINIENDDVLEASIISCNNCLGKYFIKKNNNKEKGVLKYPKGNINPIISVALVLLVLPIYFIIHINHIKVNNVIISILIIYANIILMVMILSFFQGIYNYIKNGFMIIRDVIVTRENSILNKVFTFLILLISGIIMSYLMIQMNKYFLKYLFK